MDARRQATLYKIDQAYWQVVSLHHKKKLAESYLELVQKFDSDVHKMIDEGVATRSDGLSVDVKVNEAEMALTKVNDGLVLSRMLLCQLCGLPLNEQIVLQDETNEIAKIYQKDRTLGQSLAALKVMMQTKGLCEPWMLMPLTRLSTFEERAITLKAQAI